MRTGPMVSGLFCVLFCWLCYPAASLLASGMYRLVLLAGLGFVGFLFVFLHLPFLSLEVLPAFLYTMCQTSPYVPPHISVIYSLRSGMSHITFTTWNCRGMGRPLKWGKVFSHLKSLSSDIVFLQETHIQPSEQRRLRSVWVSQVYQSTFSSKARGGAILFAEPSHLYSNRRLPIQVGGSYLSRVRSIQSL